MTKINLTAAKTAIVAAFNAAVNDVTCYYDNAPRGALLPYTVLQNVRSTSLMAGEQLNFEVAFHVDSTADNAKIELERLADEYRRTADGLLINDGVSFMGHINFVEQADTDIDSEYDYADRRQSYIARIFFME